MFPPLAYSKLTFSNHIPASHSLNYRALFNDLVRSNYAGGYNERVLNHVLTRKSHRYSEVYLSETIHPVVVARASESLILIDSSKMTTSFYCRSDIYRYLYY